MKTVPRVKVVELQSDFDQNQQRICSKSDGWRDEEGKGEDGSFPPDYRRLKITSAKKLVSSRRRRRSRRGETDGQDQTNKLRSLLSVWPLGGGATVGALGD